MKRSCSQTSTEKRERNLIHLCLYKEEKQQRRKKYTRKRASIFFTHNHHHLFCSILSAARSPLMATGRNYLNKPTTYRFINTLERDTKNPFTDQPPMFEFDETHLWNSSNHMMIPSSSPKKSSSIIPNSRITSTKKSSKNNGDHHHRTGGTAKSLPMNIPDWSKILRDDRNRVNRKSEFDDYVDEEDDDDNEDERIPPHEFLARQLEKTQIASFSVHEGIGRTLKGRDLSRVRDAIWQKTGFED